MKEKCPEKESSKSEEDTSKIGNTLWFSSGKYKPVATHAESICCLDKYKARQGYFKGILSVVLKYCIFIH